ncbi:purine-nucleoside phosphorylase [Vibrio salinus]|uniref:purine-nucleoside phosphorylase n=1 Tax=Vibrio salinus TaxID=2899784 RepID=UPI001E345486|nr:purine nucleoside permease [Vibrio salinus]MCE0492731.1 purine nucleoside permease [Vibrio salinus]
MNSLLFRLSVLAMGLSLGTAHAEALPAKPITPKVLVVTMFGGEAKPWQSHLNFSHSYALPGLNADYPDLQCDDQGVCLITTAMGYANAASTMSILSFSPDVDLRKTYIIISGIGGVAPDRATLGSANWARYVIDGGLIHQIDPRQMPSTWKSGILALGASAPGQKGRWSAGTEVYHLNDKLVDKAYNLTKTEPLLDSDEARQYRKQYQAGTPGADKPQVSVCDTLSSDTYWHGSLIAQEMQDYASLITDGKARYCTTQMEDNASLTALKRAADADRLDFGRILVMRTGSNFDREAPDQTPAESLAAQSGGFVPAVTNAYRVSYRVTQNIVDNWPQWKNGIPE